MRLTQVLALVASQRIDEAQSLVDSRPGDVVMQAGGAFWLAAARDDADGTRAALESADGMFNFAPADRMAYLAIAGDRDGVNDIAARADAIPYGHMVLVSSLLSCYCGAVFDLSVTPNFAAKLEDAGFSWPPVQSLDWPLKTW